MLSNSSSGEWHLLFPGPSSSNDPLQPAARYGHSAASTPDALLVTHGYYYNHTQKQAFWLSDSWSFSYYERRWTQLSPHCSDALVCPCARFGASAVLSDNILFLYGGDDGGNSRGERSYTYTLLADLWKMSLRVRPYRWALVSTVVPNAALTAAGFVASLLMASQSVPHAQHGAALVVDDWSRQLLVFGGMVPRRAGDTEDSAGSEHVAASNQLWALELSAMTDGVWRHLQCMNPPPMRFGHAMSGAITSALSVGVVHTLFMHGGFRRGHGNYGDLWQLRLFSPSSTRCSWTLLSTVTDQAHPAYSRVGPYPRGYASLAATSTFLLLFGGSYCSPGCVCSHETWTWDLRDHEWSSPLLRSTPAQLPQGRYKHTGAVSREEDNGGVVELVVFGGESYHPQRYHADVWLLVYDHSNHSSWWTATPLPSTLHLAVFGLTPLIAIVLVINHKRRLRREMKLT